MPFPGSHTITVNAIAIVLNQIAVIAQGNTNGTVYQSADGNFRLTISHQQLKDKVRSLTKFEQLKIAADPFTAENTRYQTIDTHIMERPLAGFSQVDIEKHVLGFNDWEKTTATQVALFGLQS